MDSSGGDSNDGVGIDTNGEDNANCGDGDTKADCSDDLDSGDGDVDSNIDNDPNCGDGKGKVDCNEDAVLMVVILILVIMVRMMMIVMVKVIM